ncbi:hypothetical protein [Clostridium magnum]|uniref:hypothetical protein n=1 Tax=Clostridium magnum TaxID=33954 RepID=UPI00092304F6|nr:hypothetical protein [Clostridium magnum]SHJ13281.1 hypothetical protein SAMN02745944_05411 [Clostridium magnum DSM 2767]
MDKDKVKEIREILQGLGCVVHEDEALRSSNEFIEFIFKDIKPPNEKQILQLIERDLKKIKLPKNIEDSLEEIMED